MNLAEHMAHTFEECLDLSKRKNADYAGEDDPFANFRATEVVGVSLQRGILVRMMDKIKRASNLLDRPPQVASESLNDTLLDIINYAAILRASLSESTEL